MAILSFREFRSNVTVAGFAGTCYKTLKSSREWLPYYVRAGENSVDSFVNLIKLSVGSDSVESMIEWQASARAKGPDGLPRHITRMWPKREAALLNGGSIYWVVQGLVQCRQRILRLDEVIGSDGIRRCAIVLNPDVIRTSVAQKRPFQGWRYLQPGDAPADLPHQRQHEDALPAALSAQLADIGVI